MVAPAAPGAARAAPGAPAKPEKKPLNRPQTPEELAFYARDHYHLTIAALIFFFPLGLVAWHFRQQLIDDNKNSHWEDAYLNSSRVIWLDVFAIIISLGLLYLFILYL